MMNKFSMKQKSITRVADMIARSKSGYNDEGGTYQPSPKEFARLTWLLEKMVLPKHLEEYTQADLEKYIRQYLEQKGHTIEEEPDPEIDATQNKTIYTIHSTKEEKQKEKASTKLLLSGQMDCPNCGQGKLQQSAEQQFDNYPTNYECPSCGNTYIRKDLVSPDAQEKQSSLEKFEEIFY